MERPQISIVTPCYNGASYIEQAILNVLEQGFDRLEHIVIDGGSQDGTVEILRRYPHLRWLSEPDTGQANALNKGFRMAQGHVIGWLNGDDTYTSGAIALGTNYLLNNTACDIVYGDCNILRENGSQLTVFRSKQPQGDEQLLGGFIHTPAVFFRRSLLDRIGYLDETLHYVLDNEYWLRAASVAKQTYLDQALANFYLQSKSKSVATFAEFLPEMCMIYRAAFAREPYRSRIPASVQRQTLARYYWAAGVNLTLAQASDRARPYLKTAVEELKVMDEPGIVAECVITRFVERDVLSWPDAVALVAALPVSNSVRDTVGSLVRDEYQPLRFHAAHNRQDWPEVRSSGFRMLLRHPGCLANRGFLSVWLESILGKRLTNTIRKIV